MKLVLLLASAMTAVLMMIHILDERYKRKEINPPNVLIDGVLNYLKKFDKNLMISDLYSDWSEYDAEI